MIRRKDPRDYSPEELKNLSPEVIKRRLPKGLHPEWLAADAYTQSRLHTSDYIGEYIWHGWALTEAFLAGISYHAAQVTPPKVKVMVQGGTVHQIFANQPLDPQGVMVIDQDAGGAVEVLQVTVLSEESEFEKIGGG
jgi:hypothetical protein